MRYDEDWSVLSDRSRRSDWLDPLKFISFGAPGWYVTFGGEIRESSSCSVNRDLALDRQTKPYTFCSAICFPQTFILALASASLPNYKAPSRKAEKAAHGRRTSIVWICIRLSSTSESVARSPPGSLYALAVRNSIAEAATVRTNSPGVGSQFVLARAWNFMCCLANLRQVDWRPRGSPFAEASEPGGSRNGSTEMRS
jgi:hypothetical protein